MGSNLFSSCRIHFSGWLERVIVTLFVTKRVGPVMRLVFKIPILFYKIGLGGLIAGKIILLETTGRRSGKNRLTPLEYSVNGQTGDYFLMSGWNGKSDWYQNACACPQVHLWRGTRKMPAEARPASNEEVVCELEKVLQIYPKASKTWSAYSGTEYDGSRKCLEKIALSFPSIWVHPD